MADHEFYEVFKTFTFECIMNEMNHRMRSKSPLPFNKPWGAPSSLPDKLSYRDETFLSGRSEFSSSRDKSNQTPERPPQLSK
ncbi:hypothetical protein Hanom_Chr16g01457261 [Helianthus anomalus]